MIVNKMSANDSVMSRSCSWRIRCGPMLTGGDKFEGEVVDGPVHHEGEN
jgi:hypothetical protein